MNGHAGAPGRATTCRACTLGRQRAWSSTSQAVLPRDDAQTVTSDNRRPQPCIPCVPARPASPVPEGRRGGGRGQEWPYAKGTLQTLSTGAHIGSRPLCTPGHTPIS